MKLNLARIQARNKIGLTFNKFVIKVKADFNQAQQNQFTFNRLSLKVKTGSTKKHRHFQEITFQGQEIFGLSSRDHFRYFQQKIYLNFTVCFISTPNFLSRFHNLAFQGQATNAVNNPNTLPTTTPSTVNKEVNRYFVYCS